MVLRLLLRPAVLASLAVHGAAVAAWYGAPAPETMARESVLVSLGDGAAEAFPEPVRDAADTDADAVDAGVEALDPLPVLADPVVVEAVPIVDPEVAPEPPSPSSDVISIPAVARVPARVAVARRRVAASAGSAALAPAAVPAAGGGGAARGAGVSRPSVPLASNARPAYPGDALARGLEGTAVLLLTVEADGSVGAVAVETTSGAPELDAAATAAASSWRYQPMLVDGVAAPERLRVPVRFRIAAR